LLTFDSKVITAEYPGRERPLLTFDSKVITAEYPGRERTKSKSAFLEYERETRSQSSTSRSESTIYILKADAVSDVSELEGKSGPANYDLEESESEPSLIFRDAEFSPIKSDETFLLGKNGYCLSTPDSSSTFNVRSTIRSSADQQSTRENLS